MPAQRLNRVLCCLAGLLTCLGSQAQAQLSFLDGVFKNVEDVNASLLFAKLTRNDGLKDGWLRGFTAEVTFSAGSMGCRNTTLTDVCSKRAEQQHAKDTLQIHCEILQLNGGKQDECDRVLSSFKTTERKVKTGDVTTTSVPKETEPAATEPVWGVEVGVGYTHIAGLESADTAIHIRGSVEELPTVSVYLAYHPTEELSPYIGVRTGLIKLSGYRGYVQDTLYTATAGSYLLGGVVGLAYGGDTFLVYGETDFTYRHFPSLEWAAVGGKVPSVLPRDLRFSTIAFNIGVQVRFK